LAINDANGNKVSIGKQWRQYGDNGDNGANGANGDNGDLMATMVIHWRSIGDQ
jgi:hypothetical protein